MALTSWAAATEMYFAAIRADSSLGEAWLGIADALKELQGMRQELVPFYQRAVKLLPKNAKAHAHLSGAYLFVHDNERAANELYVALEIEPDSIDYQVVMADLLCSVLKDYDLSEFYAQRALRIVPSHAGALFVLQQVDNARKHVDVMPKSPAHVELGDGLLKQKRWQAAASEFQAATNTEPTNAAAWMGYAKSLISAAGDEAAERPIVEADIPAFRHIVRLFPHNAEAHFYLSAALSYVANATNGYQGIAISEWTAALRINPSWLIEHIQELIQIG